METIRNAQQSVGWLVAETLVAAGAVAAAIAGFGTALYVVIGAARLARSFLA
jgi:hypothetical protein